MFLSSTGIGVSFGKGTEVLNDYRGGKGNMDLEPLEFIVLVRENGQEATGVSLEDMYFFKNLVTG